MATVIKSVNDNQHAILRDILDLHCDGSPTFDCDITISKGNFYGTFKRKTDTGSEEFKIPLPKYKFDVSPQIEGCEKIDPWGKIPLEDESIDSICVDLPFVISPMDCKSLQEEEGKNCLIARRFFGYYPRYEMFASYEHWIKECYRVLKKGGILVWKSQATVSGSVQLMTPYYSCMVAEKTGFYIKDEFILTSKVRMISSKVQKQQHARKYHSYFHVFEKDNPKRDKTGYWVRQWKAKGKETDLSLVGENKEKTVVTPSINLDERCDS